MIDLGPHATFIIWSYVGVALAVAALIAMVAYSANRARARLKALEERGIRRRSGGPSA
jgi:heme exporter protein D